MGRSSPTPTSPPTPRSPPPHNREVSGCHLSGFLCVSEDYQVAVHAGTALGEAGEARWDTVELHRGDTSRWWQRAVDMDYLPSSTPRMGCRGLSLTCGPPTPDTNTPRPTPHTWTPPPPKEVLDVAGDLSNWAFPSVNQVLWVEKGAVGRVGLWEGDAARALFADPPESVPAGPPTCPFHPTFLSRSAPASDLAVIEVGE